MVSSTIFLATSGLISGGTLLVLLKQGWSRWRAPRISVPDYQEGRFLELEGEVLGPPPKMDEFNKNSVDSTNSETQAQDNVSRWLNMASNPVGKAGGVGAPTFLGAAADGASPALDYLWTWNKVDEHLFPTIGQLTHEHVENMADLGRAIQHWDSVSQWSSPSAALVAKVKGHLAEWVAADHLQQAGHTVDMPLSSTQAGWDLDVDHVQVNVKLVDHFSSLGKHFAENPDIPVLVPFDSAGIPSDAIHLDGSHAVDFVAAKEAGATVFVDHALSNADLTTSAEAGLDVGSGHVDFHIPWITMGISAFREGKLLLEDNTNLGRALKNIAVDTAAVGGGGALGAKAGAAIGTFFAPGLGTLIGGALGGILGAITGRSVANSVKRVPLDNAKAAYDSAVSNYGYHRGRTTAEADRQWTLERQNQSSIVRNIANQAETEAKSIIEQARISMELAWRLCPDDAKNLLDATEATIKDHIQAMESRIQAVPKWKQILWPSPQFFSDRKALPEYRAFFFNWKEKRASIADRGSEPMNLRQVFDLAIPIEQGQILARQFLTQIGEKRAHAVGLAEHARLNAVRKVAEARKRALQALTDCKERLARWIDREMSAPLSTLRSTQGTLVSELRKAGINV
jgi:hypothetical protein